MSTQHYNIFWEKQFPDGEQNIYMVHSNMETSNVDYSLIISPLIDLYAKEELDYKNIPTKFKSFKEVFQCIFENKDTFFDIFCLIDGSYEDFDSDAEAEAEEDEVGKYCNEVNNAKTAEQLLEVMKKYMSGIDPVIMVREHNPLLAFLKDVQIF